MTAENPENRIKENGQEAPNMSVKDVYILCKSHLDIGFTDHAGKVVRQYVDQDFPKAIEVGRALQNTETPFIWTVGSYMLSKALDTDDGTLDQAVRDGIIHWEAMPYTPQTELMNEELLDYALQLSDNLGKRFGKKVISAKLTDVPGHTLGLVRALARHGVRFLHVGVNAVSPLPEGPRLFRWQLGTDEIVVLYCVGYMQLGDFAVLLDCNGDNSGPQTEEEVRALYADAARRYPGANVRIATLDDVAERVCALDMPVVQDEIGDTWIHGAGTDPWKISAYRAILRALEGKSLEEYDLRDNLLLVPEHTCGVNLSRYFRNGTDYYLPDMAKLTEDPGRKYMEYSWEEQRDYVRKAAEAVGLDLEQEMRVERPDLTGYRKEEDFCPEETEVELSYQLFDNADYDRFKKKYMKSFKYDFPWDFTKIGLPDYQGGIYPARAVEKWTRGSSRIYRLAFEGEVVELCGLPEVWLETDGEHVTLSWFNKAANRLPEAYWLKFRQLGEGWKLHKLGEWIDPHRVIGSLLIHGVERGVRNGQYRIDTLDAPLVAPFGRRLLDYEPDMQGETDLYFNLYNNIWNTNYPMWFGDDMKFRFVIGKTGE